MEAERNIKKVCLKGLYIFFGGGGEEGLCLKLCLLVNNFIGL